MRSHRGMAPALTGATGWLNTEPIAADALRGKVVLYVFWTYTCINWLRVSPYVKAWADKYRDGGLVVIGIHTPEFVFEEDISNVRPSVAVHEVTFPVVLDSDYAIWRAFDNHYWPAMYLADASGVIRYEHFGEDRYAETEQAIQKLLSDAGAEPGAGIVDVVGGGDEAPADWDHLETPETYFGYGRGSGFVSSGFAQNAPRRYEIPSHLPRGTWGLAGTWSIESDRATTREPDAVLAIRFHARDLNLVVGPTDGPVAFNVTVDGQQLGDDHGSDTDESGRGTVVEPRMYQLVRQARPVTDRTAHIAFPDGGASAFVVTFG